MGTLYNNNQRKTLNRFRGQSGTNRASFLPRAELLKTKTRIIRGFVEN